MTVPKLSLQKGFAPIIILLAIVVLAALGGMYYFTRRSAQTTPTQSPIQAPTQASSNPINSWETYTNETYGYTLKYPAQFTIKNAQELGYEMGGDAVYFVSKTKSTPTTKDTVIMIDSITKIGEGCDTIADCEENVTKYFNELHSRSSQPENELGLGKKMEIKIKNLMIDTHNAVETKSIDLFGNQKDYFNSRSIYIQKNATLIIRIRTIVYDEKDKATANAMLDQILSTFRFVDKVSMRNWKTYRSGEGRYSIEYAPELSPSERDLATLQLGFPAAAPIVSFVATPDTTAFGSSVDILVGNNPDNLTIEEFTAKYIKGVPSGSKFQPITLDGIEGKRSSDFPGLVAGEDVFVKHGGKIYYIAFHEGTIQKNVDSQVVFNSMLSTFKFIE